MKAPLNIMGFLAVLLPGITLTTLFLAKPSGDLFLYAALWGLAGLLLSRLGIIPPLPEWNAYGLGAVLGLGLIFVAIFSVAAFPLAIFGWMVNRHWPRLNLPPLTKRSRTLLIALVINALVWMVLRRLAVPTNPDPMVLNLLMDLLYTLGVSLVIQIPVLAVIATSKRLGSAALLLPIISLGGLLNFFDPGYFTFDMWSLINFVIVAGTLLICPLWLIVAPGRKWSVLLPWGLMMMLAALLPSIAQTFILELPYVNLATWLSRITAAVPYLIALALSVENHGQMVEREPRPLMPQLRPFPFWRRPEIRKEPVAEIA